MTMEPHESKSPRRLPDRCLQCGRFVGLYPVGFYCDTHCSACICAQCPGVTGPGVYGVTGAK